MADRRSRPRRLTLRFPDPDPCERMKTRLSSVLLFAILLLTAACTSARVESGSGSVGTGGSSPSTAGGTGASEGAGSTGATAPSSPTAPSSASTPTRTVRVSSLLSDGQTYGVGMPIVLFFSPIPTDAAAFTKAVKVTVNGQPANGAWYWEQPTADEVKSQTVEAHYRAKDYWPAHAKIHVDIPIGG
jgi:Bacterial Ig domain